jgi:hypothetical protein
MRLLRMPLIAMVVGGGTMLAGMWGTASAAPGDPEWFRSSTIQPNGGREFGQPQTQVPPPAAMPPGNGQNGAAQNDFPDDTVHDWVVASARVARSRALLHLAEKQLTDSIRDSQFSFEQSKEYRQAQAEEKQAYEAYTAARQKALASVMSDSKYQEALRARDEIGAELERLRAYAKPNPIPREDLLALASQKLQFASDAHNMERDALEKDANVQDLRQKMVQAAAKSSDLRATFDGSIRTNPQIAQARHNLDVARVELITAEAYYDASATASSVAADYSYYRHRWDGLSPRVAGGLWSPLGYTVGD